MNENFYSDLYEDEKKSQHKNLISNEQSNSSSGSSLGTKQILKSFDSKISSASSIYILQHNQRSLDIDVVRSIYDNQLQQQQLAASKHNVAGSCKSLSELDNMKKKTLNNLKSYRTKFQTLNTRLRTKRKDIKKRERLIRKNGDSNINRVNIEKRGRKYIADLFNTIIDMKWRYLLLTFVLGFLVSWVVFAFAWFALQHVQADCVVNLQTDSFLSAILFSIETQQTIGYGSRYINSTCHLAAIIVMIQSCFSVLLQSFMGGIVFAKLSRPKKRTETLIFSKNAVVSLRDGQFCFMCRVGDMRKSHIIQARVRMFLIRTRYTKEGEIIPWNAQELEVGNRLNSSDRLLFMPIIVEHLITEASPLWDLIVKKQVKLADGGTTVEQPCCFKNEDFEIIVILEGTVEATGATTQARTSYVSNEILWNHIFEPLVDRYLNKATVDYSKFNETINLQFDKDYDTKALIKHSESNLKLQQQQQPQQHQAINASNVQIMVEINEKDKNGKRKKVLTRQRSVTCSSGRDNFSSAYSSESKDTAYYSDNL